MSTIAILGANGRLSRAVAKAFLAARWTVKAISRSGQPLAELQGAEFLAADAMIASDLIRATSGADVIFNGLNPLYTEWEAKALPLAVNALAAAKANRATMLFPGNIYGFGAGMPRDLTESVIEKPTTSKGSIRVAMENLFRQAAMKDGVQTIILRAGDFFGGTGPGTWLDLGMANKLAKGIFTHPGNPDTVHAFAYLPDLAQAFLAAAEKRGTLQPFELIHFEGHNVTTAAIQDATETAIGRKLKRASLPWTMIRIAGVFWPMGRELARMSYLWDREHRLQSDRFRTLLVEPQHTPLDIAVRTALDDQGLLPVQLEKAA